MTYLDAALLGLLQGLTEFLPISSSGHLVLAQEALGLKTDPGSLSFEIVVHLGTLLAVFMYFRNTIVQLVRSLFNKEMRDSHRLILMVALGTIPAVIIGLTAKKLFPEIFTSALLAASMLIVNGGVLLLTGLAKPCDSQLTAKRSVLIGLAQACALLPGISRSGSTISAGMFLGIDPSRAAEFSFLLAIPAILGAAVLDATALGALDGELLGIYLTGAVTACVSGYLAVSWLMRLIKGGKFLYFGIYCLAIGVGSLFLI
jgi:undecaprenyl-diphosphatase